MFEPSNMLLKYMDASPRDIYDIIGALIGYINADPHFRTNDFEEAVRYVLTHGVAERELFDNFDAGMEYIEDSSRWNEEYYSYAVAYLKDNFCRKRIEHVKRIAHKLYPVSAPLKSQEKIQSQDMGSKKNDHTSKERKEPLKKVQDQQDREKEYSISLKDAIMSGISVVLLVMLVIAIVFIIKSIDN